MSANDRQHGGDHYRAGGVQHWDFVHNAGLGYHAGNATKYVARWRKKGGRVDLKKAVHYLDKAIELGITPPEPMERVTAAVIEFTTSDDNIQELEALIILDISLGLYHVAKGRIQRLLEATTD